DARRPTCLGTTSIAYGPPCRLARDRRLAPPTAHRAAGCAGHSGQAVKTDRSSPDRHRGTPLACSGLGRHRSLRREMLERPSAADSIRALPDSTARGGDGTPRRWLVPYLNTDLARIMPTSSPHVIAERIEQMLQNVAHFLRRLSQ